MGVAVVKGAKFNVNVKLAMQKVPIHILHGMLYDMQVISKREGTTTMEVFDSKWGISKDRQEDKVGFMLNVTCKA